MSASREKKQRQSADASKLSPRAQEERAKAAKRKRKTILYSVIGAVVAVLAAALLIWDSGVLSRGATVATINGKKVTAAQLSYYYYNNSVYSTAQAYSQYGLSDYYPFSLSASPREQAITFDAASQLGIDEEYVGKSYHEYFIDEALNSLRQVYALNDAAAQAGYTLSAEGKQNVEEAFDSIDSARDQYLSAYGANLSRSTYLQQIYGKAMTAKAYRSCLEQAQLASEFYQDSFDSLTDFGSQAVEAYYEENKDALDTFQYYYQIIDGSAESTLDSEGNTVEPTEEEQQAALDAAKAEADALQQSVDGKLDAVKGDDGFTEASGVFTSTDSLYYEWLTDSAREPGDATVIESGSSYYVVVFARRYLDETPTVNVRNLLVEAVHEDDISTEEDESGDDPDEADFETAREKAQELLDQWKAGEATEDSFAALAQEQSADTATSSNGGLRLQVYRGQLADEVDAWLFDSAHESGDTGLALDETSSTVGCHILYYVGQDLPVWEGSVRAALWLDDVEARYEIVKKDNADSAVDS